MNVKRGLFRRRVTSRQASRVPGVRDWGGTGSDLVLVLPAHSAYVPEKVPPIFGFYAKVDELGYAMKWDVFISHASEDKDAAAKPLANELSARGLRVWFDDVVLKLGDSLQRQIDIGLSQSRFGVVILSDKFFSKHWTRKELDGLAAKEVSGRKAILPIWHKISL